MRPQSASSANGGAIATDSPAQTIACARCGKHVTSEAPRCPECGADPRTGIATFKRGEMDRARICQGVWIRCLAFLIDLLVVGTVTLLASLLVYLVPVGGGAFAEVGKEPSSRPLWAVALCGSCIYFWWSEAVWGRTLGKRLCELRVVRRDGGLSIVPWAAVTSSRRGPSPRRP